MQKLLILSGVVTFLAFISQHRTEYCEASGYRYRTRDDLAYILMVILLVVFSGMRVAYNDTGSYIDGFNSAPLIGEFLHNPENYNLFTNPLFYFFQSLLKTVADHAQWLIFLTSLFVQICFVRFFKRYSKHFAFTIFLYFAYGTFCFTMAAIKQVVAMAILTIALPYLEEKKWVRYYLLVFVAMLFHTYALIFVALPLFRRRPWRLFTFMFVILMVLIMMNFREVIEEFMSQANEVGKTLEDYEVFDDHTVNILRLAVYAVVPLMSLLFRKWIFAGAEARDYVLVHMSILSLAFMSMGTQAGANMFARMATYFELGTLCCLPWMLERIFEKKSYRFVAVVACAMFFAYFVYSFGINVRFAEVYQAAPIWSLFAW